jgi:hypothetical protein
MQQGFWQRTVNFNFDSENLLRAPTQSYKFFKNQRDFYHCSRINEEYLTIFKFTMRKLFWLKRQGIYYCLFLPSNNSWYLRVIKDFLLLMFLVSQYWVSQWSISNFLLIGEDININNARVLRRFSWQHCEMLLKVYKFQMGMPHLWICEL